MKKRYFIILSLVLSLSTAVSALAQNVKLKVLDWNVLSFQRTDKSGESSGFPVADHLALIKAQNPDVICLNEFETGTSRMGKEKMSELAKDLDMYAYYIMSYPKDEGYYGNVILSKYPIISSASELHDYEHSSGAGNYQWNGGWQVYYYGSDQRSVGYVDIAVPSGSGISVVRIVCTHLDHDNSYGDYVRTLQANKVAEFASLSSPIYPTILCGDLNTISDYALQVFNSNGDHVGYNWVDHIYSFPQGKWSSASFTSIDCGNLSDHQPIVATLTLN